MSVSATHPEFRKNLLKWQVVRDVVNSEVKKYLKDIDPSDRKRCERYRDDARLVNFTAKTKQGLVGAATRKHFELSLPSSIEYIKMDATGNKLNLSRLYKEAVGEVLQSGRYGLLSDYPASEENLTAADVEQLNYKARIYKYPAENIINWQETVINGQATLVLVTLLERVAKVGEDGFTWESEKQYRVLRLEDGIYVQYLFNEAEELIHTYVPRKFDGSAWTEIPFSFIGAEDNDAVVDASPLYDLAELNIGHYRNSADYEESVHIIGQPTLMISTSLSSEEFLAANPNGILIGARRGHNLGSGGNAFMLQAQPNTLAYEAMKLKEEQAIMLGARLIMQAGSNETAEAARIKSTGEHSVLSTIVQNVADSIKQSIFWCAQFMSVTEDQEEIILEPSLQFFDETLDPNQIMAQLQLYNSGVIAQTDIRDTLRRTGLISPDRTDEDIDSDVDQSNPLGNMQWPSPEQEQPIGE